MAPTGLYWTDPREAPPPSNPPQPTGAVGTTDPAIALVNAYQEYLRRSGHTQDPLAAQRGQASGPRAFGGAGQMDPVQLLKFAGNPYRQISHGANAGQMAQTYDLGGGKRANVYYDENGRRRVNVYGGR